MLLKAKLIDHEGAESKMPTKGTKGSAGWDLYAAIPSPVTIKPGNLVKIPSGVAVEFPSEQLVGFLFARSGLATKHGITLSNGVGVIDSDYTGELIVGLCNVSDEAYTIEPGERFAQLVVMSVIPTEIKADDNIKRTDRSDNGFGSTGKF